MFLYQKKITYLSLYESGEKIFPAGFASLYLDKERLCVIIQIKNAEKEQENNLPVDLVTEKKKINIGMIGVVSGRGSLKKSFDHYKEKVLVGTSEIEPDNICGIEIKLSESRSIVGRWKDICSDDREPSVTEEASVEKEEKEEGEEPENLRKVLLPIQEEPDLKAVSIAPDKWEQLKSQFKVIHPFGDEREFISMEIKDFTVLRENYQKLVNNSFLLHGFYNYRHLILGKDYKIGADNETCFYLGVPGVFFEREKMVAVMFGFEGFESSGSVEIGKFGYYLRRVEI